MKIDFDSKGDLVNSGVKIIKLLQAKGFEAFFVGGTVRNLLLKLPLEDIDIATSAFPEQVEKILAKAKLPYQSFGKKFGTILAMPKDGQKIEITTFRKEGRYSDQRHPDKVVFINDFKKDAKRRDFTINALYFDPIKEQLFDTVNGLKDLKGKLIKFVGKPQNRIDEDPLRMMRAVRFATTLNFKLEKNSFAAIKTRAKLIQLVAGQRVKGELDKILLSKSRVQGIELLDKIGLLKFLIPDYNKLRKITHELKTYHLEGDVFKHTMNSLDHVNTLPEIYTMIFHDFGKVSTGKKELNDGQWVIRYRGHQQASADLFNHFAKRLKFSRIDRNLINWLILEHDNRSNFREMKLINQLAFVLHKDFPTLLNVWRADSLANIRVLDDGTIGSKESAANQIVYELLRKLKPKRMLISELTQGDLIMKLSKLKAGPRIKKIQDLIVEQIYLSKIKNQTDLRKFLSKKS